MKSTLICIGQEAFFSFLSCSISLLCYIMMIGLDTSAQVSEKGWCVAVSPRVSCIFLVAVIPGSHFAGMAVYVGCGRPASCRFWGPAAVKLYTEYFPIKSKPNQHQKRLQNIPDPASALFNPGNQKRHAAELHLSIVTSRFRCRLLCLIKHLLTITKKNAFKSIYWDKMMIINITKDFKGTWAFLLGFIIKMLVLWT